MNNIGKYAALGAAAGLFVLTTPVFAQNNNAASVNAAGMPADHSTPAEQAQTRALNQAIAGANRAADAKAQTQRQQYEAQRAQYSEQRARYQDAMARHTRQQDAYDARRNAYGLARARYNAALIHHRHDWPDNDRWVLAGAAPHPMGMAVQFLDGTSAGTISSVARGTSGLAEAFLLQLNGGGKAWIEGADLRFNAADDALMTDLDAQDFQAIIGQSTAAAP